MSDSATAQHNLGLARRAARDVSGAAEAFRAAVKLDPDFMAAVVALAETSAALGEHEEAIRLYESALARCPEDAVLYAGLGDCLHASQRLTEAVAAYQHAVRRNPELTGAWWGLGCALLTRREATMIAAQVTSKARVLALATTIRPRATVRPPKYSPTTAPISASVLSTFSPVRK